MSNPDAYDEHGNPLYLQDCLTVCPAAHIDEAREIAAWHCGNVENLMDALPANMLPTAIPPDVAPQSNGERFTVSAAAGVLTLEWGYQS